MRYFNSICVLLAFGCAPKNSSGCGSTEGDKARLRFSYEAQTVECSGVCDVTRPLMVGATTGMRASGDLEEQGMTVRSSDSNLLTFTTGEEAHQCVKKEKNAEGKDVETSRPVDTGTKCASGETARVTLKYSASAIRAGDAKVQVYVSDRLIDSLTIPTVEATAIAAPASVSATVGGNVDIAVTVKAGDQNLIPGNEGVTFAVSNPAVATVTRKTDLSQSDFVAKGLTAGTTNVVFRAGAIETTVQVNVQ